MTLEDFDGELARDIRWYGRDVRVGLFLPQHRALVVEQKMERVAQKV